MIANFVLGVAILTKNEDKYFPSSITNWWTDWIGDSIDLWKDNEKLIRTLPVLHEPHEITYDFDVYLTSLPEDLIPARIEWIKNHGFPDKPVVMRHDKLSYCEENGFDVLIDDKPSTIKEFRARNTVQIIQFVPDYVNRCMIVSGVPVAFNHLGVQLELDRMQKKLDAGEVNYSAMVAALVKPGDAIIESLTPRKADMWHMATGVSGEAGELLDAIKKFIVYEKPLDRCNVIEELGDLEFYMERIRQLIQVTREQVLEKNISKLSVRYNKGKYSNKAAKTRADKK